MEVSCVILALGLSPLGIVHCMGWVDKVFVNPGQPVWTLWRVILVDPITLCFPAI
jgi:hypothetical protein